MNPDSYGCDGRHELTDIRCGLDPIVTVEGTGERYCQYCYDIYLEPEQIMAVKNLKRVGMI